LELRTLQIDLTRAPVVCIFFPPYNEEPKNLEPLLAALGDKGVYVIVIDDNSPEGGDGELGRPASQPSLDLRWTFLHAAEGRRGSGRHIRRAVAARSPAIRSSCWNGLRFSPRPANDQVNTHMIEAGGRRRSRCELRLRGTFPAARAEWGRASPTYLDGRNRNIAPLVLGVRVRDWTGGLVVQMLIGALRPRGQSSSNRILHSKGLRVSDRDTYRASTRPASTSSRGVPITFADRRGRRLRIFFLSKGIVAESDLESSSPQAGRDARRL